MTTDQRKPLTRERQKEFQQIIETFLGASATTLSSNLRECRLLCPMVDKLLENATDRIRGNRPENFAFTWADLRLCFRTAAEIAALLLEAQDCQEAIVLLKERLQDD